MSGICLSSHIKPKSKLTKQIRGKYISSLNCFCGTWLNLMLFYTWILIQWFFGILMISSGHDEISWLQLMFCQASSIQVKHTREFCLFHKHDEVWGETDMHRGMRFGSYLTQVFFNLAPNNELCGFSNNRQLNTYHLARCPEVVKIWSKGVQETLKLELLKIW